MKAKELPISLFHSFRLRYGKVAATNDRLPVIVSLTSIPDRLATLDITISSLLNQQRPPEKIVLWLNHALENNLPKHLIKLQSNFFEIHYCKGTSSYRKLLPTLEMYKNSVIVTCDDDMIYPAHWLENLYDAHLNKPDYVISQVGRLIERDNNGILKSYEEWPFIRTEKCAKNLLPIGYGGVLYPLGTFDKKVFDEKLYMELCPKADDLWFKAMSLLNGKHTYCASEKARPIPIMRTQKHSLRHTNIGLDGNRKQWQALCDYFPELKKI